MGLFIAAVLFMVVGLALEGITSWIAIMGARKRHPELWIHSGRPTLMGNSDLRQAWPLVAYYRDRKYLDHVRRGEAEYPPVVDQDALAFAERLRGPLVFTYYAAWIGIGACLVLMLALGILSLAGWR